MPFPLKLIGVPGSPYSRKLRALFRYRRIPFVWIQLGSAEAQKLPKPPVSLVPIVVFPNEAGEYLWAVVDSTPIIWELEHHFIDRSVIPPDPVLAFLNALLEDFADEWVAKAMMHYRWSNLPDTQRASRTIVTWANIGVSIEAREAMAEKFARRQQARLKEIIGVSEVTKTMIEEGYRRILEILDFHFIERQFLFGHRPSSADFAFFGQYTQLVQVDPTPMRVAFDIAPKIYAWCDVMEDLSGCEVQAENWMTREQLPETLHRLLVEVREIYLPFLCANAAAYQNGDPEFTCELRGVIWTQRTFPYQVKCLNNLQIAYMALSEEDKRFLQPWVGSSKQLLL